VPWIQNYNPLHNSILSTAVAALPTVLLFYLLAFKKVRPHLAGFSSAMLAVAIAIFVNGMPAKLAVAAFGYGAFFGWLPISWIVLNGVFLYNLTVATGQFEIIKTSVGAVSQDRRLQALLIAFSFGAFIEGAAGFGTPIAICSALLVGLGFNPFYAVSICLIANTAPVAFGSLGIPTITLAAVTDLPLMRLSQLTGRILPLTSVIVPLWLVRTMCSWKETFQVFPAAMVCGASFALTQYYISNHHGPYLVDIIGGVCSLIVMVIFLRYWKPRRIWRFEHEQEQLHSGSHSHKPGTIARAWMPFAFLSLMVLLWGTPNINRLLNKMTVPIPVPSLHLNVVRTLPVVVKPTTESAIYNLNWLAATGTAILLTVISSAILLRVPAGDLWLLFRKTFKQLSIPLLTIPSILGLGFVSRYSGLDSILGLAFTHTSVFYPLFGTLLGWLGVFLTGSDTASNALFGNLQKVTASQLGLSPILMASANSCGGVMGKMIDAQSIVIGTAATNQVGAEGDVFRFVFWHSLALAALVGIEAILIAYVFPEMIP
jgi:lactate permease